MVSCKFTTISDLLNLDGPTPLSEVRPPSEVKALLDEQRFAYDHYFYGVTITVHPGFRLPRTKYAIAKLSPKQQFQKIKPLIEKTFEGFIYCFYTEYTQKGVIHFHGVAAHPSYKQRNSTVESTLKYQLSYFGTRNSNRDAIAPVSDWTKWWNYIQKENGNVLINTSIDSL